MLQDNVKKVHIQSSEAKPESAGMVRSVSNATESSGSSRQSLVQLHSADPKQVCGKLLSAFQKSKCSVPVWVVGSSSNNDELCSNPISSARCKLISTAFAVFTQTTLCCNWMIVCAGMHGWG